jgi:TolA-binding protein
MRFTHWQASRAILAAMALGGLLAATPAAAQDDQARLRKLEDQVRALQRKVFPGPDGKFFAPEVNTSQVQASPQPTGIPAATPLTDVLARLDSIEAQLNRLTARSEVNENAISMIEDRLDKLEGGGKIVVPTDLAPTQPTGAIEVPDDNRPALAPKAPARTIATTPSGPSSERLAKVRAVAKPDTGDAADDEYTYGFRLWEAGLYPEAQQQLRLYLDKYPGDAKVSYGRNLLGRAYLDDNQPKAAAPYFLENYQKDPNGARAPDSLLFLAESMIALKDNTRACRALAEFGDKYAGLATGRLQDQYARDRKRAGCK